jgi:carbonic anhydrase
MHAAAPAGLPRSGPPRAAWERLTPGNARFVAGVLAPRAACATVRERLREGQIPFAAVLCCSDSRVAPELVFDLELGDIFVVRTAGHVVDEVVEASLQFGLEHLRIPLVVVLGHAGCAAVSLAAAAEDDPPSVLLRAIRPAIRRAARQHARQEHHTIGDRPGIEARPGAPADPLTPAIDEHALLTAKRLRESAPVGEALGRLGATVLGARYDLATGEVTWLGP